MSTQALTASLARLRMRIRTQGIAAGVLWALAAGAGSLLVWAWLDLLLDASPALRVAGSMAAIAVLVAVLAFFLRRLMRQTAEGQLARRLDAAAGASGQIVSGYDLLRHAESSPESPAGLSAGLARLASDRAGTLAAAAPLERVAPAQLLLRPLGAVAAIAAVIGLLAVVSPRLVATQWGRLVHPWGDQPVFSQIQIDVQPGDVAVVYGGDVEIRASVRGGTASNLETVLVSEKGAEEIVPMFAEANGTWRTSLTNVTAAGKYFVRSHQARTGHFALRVITVPRITAVTASIEAPAYTRLRAIEGPIPSAGIAALPQSTITFRAKSNRPLSGGTLQVVTADGTQQVAMTASGDEVQAQVQVKAGGGGKVLLHVKDTGGQESTDPFTTGITLLEDQRPFVRVVDPRPQSYATPNARLPVSVLAEDDFGLTAITLYRSLNESRALGIDLPLKPEGPPRQRGQADLDLGPLGLRPGDIIRLSARAQDNDAAGPKGSESPSVTVQIISQQDYNRMLVARAGLEMLLSKYQQAQRRLEQIEAELRRMKEELAKAQGTSPLSDPQKQDANTTAEAAEKGAEEVERSKEVVLPFDIDQALAGQLDDVVKRLRTVSGKLKEGTGKPGATVQDQIALLEELIKEVEREKREFAAEVTIPLEHLAKVYALVADQAKFVQLYKREAGLAERLTAMKDNAGEDAREKPRLRETEEEQKEVRLALLKLLDEIEAHAGTLPQDHEQLGPFRKSAEEFAARVREAEIDGHMETAESALGELWVGMARQEAVIAARLLKDFIDESEALGGQGQGCLTFMPSLSRNMGNTLAQLLGAAGLGGSGGYSMAGNSGENVGLYGNSPISLSQQAGGMPSGGGPTGGGLEEIAASRGNAEIVGTATPTGASALPVPAQYRRRVDQYFQRVADELQKE